MQADLLLFIPGDVEKIEAKSGIHKQSGHDLDRVRGHLIDSNQEEEGEYGDDVEKGSDNGTRGGCLLTGGHHEHK